MAETPKDDSPKTLTAQEIDGNSTLLPMLIVGLILIAIGYPVIMIFV